MSKFRKGILIFGMIALCIAAALSTFLILLFSGALATDRIVLIYQISDESKVFDGEPLLPKEWTLMGGQLVKGHTAKVELIGSQTEAGKSESDMNVRIYDEFGADVSKEYAVRVEKGVLEVTACSLFVRLNSAEAIYNGKNVSFDDYSVVSGNLARGHRLGAELLGVTIAEVGETIPGNLLWPAVYDMNGRDVSDNYVISFSLGTSSGSVRIVPRPIGVRPVGGEKTFDARPLVCDRFELYTGSLVEGHYIAAEYAAADGGAAPITNAGETEVTVYATVYDAAGKDVTHNYAIATEQAILKVTPRDLVLTAKSASWEYDGKEHTLADGEERDTAPFSAVGLAEGDSVSVVYAGSVKDLGSAENTIAEYVIGSGNENYRVTCLSGSLSVTKAQLTVRLKPLTKEYDGKPFQTEDYYVFEPALPEEFRFESDALRLLEGTVDVVNATYQVTEYAVKNGEEDCTKNFLITVAAGKLAIEPKKLNFKIDLLDPAFLTKEYDGTPFAVPVDRTALLDETEGPAEGHVFAGVKCVPVVKPCENLRCDLTGVTVFDSEGRDVSGNYAIGDASPEYLSVTVVKRAVTVVADSAEKEYDGFPLKGTVSCAALAAGDSVRVKEASELTEAGSATNLSSFEIVSASGEPITDSCYEIVSVKRGTLTVRKKRVAITVQDYACDYGETVSRETLLSRVSYASPFRQEDFTNDWQSVYTEAGKYELALKFSGAPALLKNYEIDFTAGELTIRKRVVNVTMADGEKYFDGKPVKAEDFAYTYDEAQLPEGGELRLAESGLLGMTDAGAYEASVTFAVYQNGELNPNYEAIVSSARYTIKKRTVFLRWADGAPRSKTYDGTKFEVNYAYLEFYDQSGDFTEDFELTDLAYDDVVRVLSAEGTPLPQSLNLRYPRAVAKNGNGETISDRNLEILIEEDVEITVTKREITFTVSPLTIPQTLTDEQKEDYESRDYASLVTVNGLAAGDTAQKIFSVYIDLEENMIAVQPGRDPKFTNALGEDVSDCYTITRQYGVIIRV